MDGQKNKQDKTISPDYWPSHESGGRSNPATAGRTANNSLNLVDHHIYAAVPARIRAASSDDRSVGSLVSLNSDNSAASGFNSHNNPRKTQLQDNPLRQSTGASSRKQSNDDSANSDAKILLDQDIRSFSSDHRISRLQDNSLRQSSGTSSRKQSNDDSVHSDTKTLCDQEVTDVPTDHNFGSIDVPLSNLGHEQGLVPIVTTVTSGSPPDTSLPGDTEDHVVPEPVLSRIRKDCELKEEFLKRPNLPNYLAPPPPPMSMSAQNSRLDDDNCRTPSLPPLASPEVDVVSSPITQHLHHSSGPGALASNAHSYSDRQKMSSNTPEAFGHASQHDFNPDAFNVHGEPSSFAKQEVGNGRQYPQNMDSLGELMIIVCHLKLYSNWKF